METDSDAEHGTVLEQQSSTVAHTMAVIDGMFELQALTNTRQTRATTSVYNTATSCSQSIKVTHSGILSLTLTLSIRSSMLQEL